MKKLIILLLAFSLTGTIAAQEYSLYQMREVWNANYLNPGFIPRHQFVVSLPSVRAGFQTVGLRGKSIFTYDQGSEVFRVNGGIQAGDVSRDFTLRNNLQVDAFGIGFRANRGFVSLTTQTVVESRMRFPETFLRTVIEGTANQLNTPLNIGPSWDAMAYQKVSLGFGYALTPRLSVGGRLNRLLGLGSIQTSRSNLTILQSDDIYQTTVNLDYQVNYYGAGQFEPIDRTVEGLTNFEDAITDDDLETSDELGFRQINQSNNGWSVDLGAEYFYNDRLTLSAAFINLGSINWKNQTQQVSISGEASFEGVDVAEMEENEDYEPFPDLDTVGTFEAISGMSYRQALAPHSYLGANYTLNRYIELGGLLFNELSPGGGFTAFSLSSRFSLGRILGLGIVYNLQHQASNSFGANVALNLGPFQVYGIAEDLSAVVNPSSFDGGSLRAGLNLSFGRKKSEAQLADLRQGVDPFYATTGPITSTRKKRKRTKSAKAPRRSAKQKTAKESNQRLSPEPAPGTTPKPTSTERKTIGSSYSLELDMFDEEDQEAVEVVYMDLYKEAPNGQRELVRTGRYPMGKVATMLEISNDWHVAKISAYQYDTVEIRFQADPEKPLQQRWYMASTEQPVTIADKPLSEEPLAETPEDPPVVQEQPEVKASPEEAQPTQPQPEKAEPPAVEKEPAKAVIPEVAPDKEPEPADSEPISNSAELQTPEKEEEQIEPTAPAVEPEPVEQQPATPPASEQRLQPASSDYILTARTSLRAAPDSKSKVISRMSEGTELLLLERTNQWWWLVSMGGWEGYVKAHLLKDKD